MTAWSIFTHGDLPPLPGEPVPPPLAKPLPDGIVTPRPEERVSDYDARRIVRQGKVPRGLRRAAERERDRWRCGMLGDYALLIETARSADEVLTLLGEVERRFGLKMRGRR